MMRRWARAARPPPTAALGFVAGQGFAHSLLPDIGHLTSGAVWVRPLVPWIRHLESVLVTARPSHPDEPAPRDAVAATRPRTNRTRPTQPTPPRSLKRAGRCYARVDGAHFDVNRMGMFLRAPGIVETRRPETGERLWDDYA